LREIHLAIHAGQTQQKTAHIAIRINPDFELKGSGMKMGGGAKPFGLDVALVPKALALIKHSHARFIGFHCYSGSQNLKADSLIETQAKSIALCEQLCDDAQMSAELFNIGGGFGIPYFPGEQALDYARVCHELSREAHALAQRRPQTKLALELGRYLVGEAGLYVCEVIERKMSHGQVFLITNGGLHHHLSASGNFGQVLRKNYPLCLAHQVCADELETVQVVGPLCTPLDLLGNAVKLPRADEHDLIAIFQSGAYGYTASPHLFLNHPKPVEILL
jgi:diaminopimelate decarboxylase